MKQAIGSLPDLIGRSLRWFKEILEGIASRVVRWVQGPPPCETRAGRNQLNLSDDELKVVTDQHGPDISSICGGMTEAAAVRVFELALQLALARTLRAVDAHTGSHRRHRFRVSWT